MRDAVPDSYAHAVAHAHRVGDRHMAARLLVGWRAGEDFQPVPLDQFQHRPKAPGKLGGAGYCEECGKVYPMTRRARRFCSGKCRRVWHHSGKVGS